MNIIQVYKKYPKQEDCIRHLESIRWKGKPTCPYCKSKNCTPMPKEHRYHCNSCNTSYSVTVGTIFHKTKIVFPFIVIPKVMGDLIINVDFFNGSRVEARSRCACGSGLPYCMCCGRTPGVEEIASGIF